MSSGSDGGILFPRRRVLIFLCMTWCWL